MKPPKRPTEPSSPIHAAFAQRLAEVCADKGLSGRGTQTQLARLVKKTQQGVKKWLDGQGFPALETAIQIAEWGNVNVNWLLQGSGPKLKEPERVEMRAVVLDEAIRQLPRESRIDLVDSLRAKLQRANKIEPNEPGGRYSAMLEAYEADPTAKKH